MNEKILPHDIEAEKSVIGAMLISPDAVVDVIDKIKPDDFYQKEHTEIFAAIIELYKRSVSIDLLTVCDELKSRKALEIVGGRAYLARLTSEVPVTSNAKDYARIILEKSNLRKLIKEADTIKSKAFEASEKTEDILDFAEQSIFEIAHDNQARNYEDINDILVKNVQEIQRLEKNKGVIPGIATGFRDLDAQLSGLQRSDLVVVAARPGMGKTSFALNVAEQTANAGNSVLIFSMEMSNTQLGQRMLAMQARVEMEKIKKGRMDAEDWKRVSLAMDDFSETSITIDDTPGISILEMKNKCRRLKADKGLDLVIIDYLQLMSMDGRTDNRQQEISALSRNIKLLAKEMDCAVILLSQLSRAPEMRPNHRPQLSDLRESGAIEQDADIVIFLLREDYYFNDEEEIDPSKIGVCEVNIAKHRSGPTGMVYLTWIERYTKFSDKESGSYER